MAATKSNSSLVWSANGRTVTIGSGYRGTLNVTNVSVVVGYDPSRVKLILPQYILDTLKGHQEVKDFVLTKNGREVMRFKNVLGKRLSIYPSAKATNYKYWTVSSKATIPNGIGYGRSNNTAIGASSQNFKGEVDGRLYTQVRTIDLRNSKGATTIYGNAATNTIYASQGGSKIYGLGGNDTIYGGSGRDTFYFGTADGTDTVMNYKGGQDVIRLTNGKYTAAQFKSHVKLNKSNGEVDITNGKTTIRVMKALGQKLTVYGADGKLIYDAFVRDNNPSYNRKTGTVALNKNYTGSFDLRSKAYASAANVNASAATNRVSLYGNSKNNTLTASKGGSDIHGGGGNDTMVGGAGADQFYYGKNDGNVTIKNFDTKNDRLVLSDNTKSKSYGGDAKAKTFWYSLGNGKKVTIAGGFGKWINITYANGRKNSLQVCNGGFLDRNHKSVTLTANYNTEFSFSRNAPWATTVDASLSRYKTTLYGTSDSNVVTASKGGSKIFAGRGNNIINCNSGQDIIYLNKNDGTDKIYNLQKNDIIYLNNVLSAKDVWAKVENNVLYMGINGGPVKAQVMGWKQGKSFQVVYGKDNSQRLHTVTSSGRTVKVSN